jgi:serine/threonine-protein kinase
VSPKARRRGGASIAPAAVEPLEGDAVARAGVVLADRFRLEERIGSGGMSSIWVATDLVSDGQVAVKVMSRPESRRDDLIERFRREAEVAKRLRGPHFVAILDYGEQDRVPFIVMQLLEGENLQQRLARRAADAPPDAPGSAGTLSLQECVALVSDLAEGLRIAHRDGVIHRDLKPANLYFARLPSPLRRARNEVLKILDFGIARSDAYAARLTAAGSIVGSLFYMSPEQARAEPNIDRRSDLWQVGAVLYRCLTGRRPFEGSPGAVLTRLAREDVPPPSRVNQELPRALDPFFAKALAKDPADRFPTIDELASAFLEAARQVSGTRPAVRPPAAPPPSAGEAPRPTLPTVVGGRRYEDYASLRSSRSDRPTPDSGPRIAPPDPSLLEEEDRRSTVVPARGDDARSTLRPFYTLYRPPSPAPSPWIDPSPRSSGSKVDWVIAVLVGLTILGLFLVAIVAVVHG